MAGRRSAVFVDRDGTINVERGYIARPQDLELIDGAGDALRALNDAGFLAVVVSNQSGVARGLMTEEDLAVVHQALEDMLAVHGARIDAAYYCPNYRDGVIERLTRDTSCRKPNTGMLDAAAQDLGIDLASSYVVGDDVTDIELAERAGLPAVLVLTGKGRDSVRTLRERGVAVAHVAADLGDAVRWILGRRSRSTAEAGGS